MEASGSAERRMNNLDKPKQDELMRKKKKSAAMNWNIIIILSLIIFLVLLVLYIYYFVDFGVGGISGAIADGSAGSIVGENIGNAISSAVGATIGGMIGLAEDAVNDLKIGTQKIGEPCDSHANCAGWIPGTPGAAACCNGKCEKQLADWSGVGYCPNECKDAPAPLGGDCRRGYSWPRKEGQPCDTNAACSTGLCKSGVCAPTCPNDTNQTTYTCWYDRGVGRIPNKRPCSDFDNRLRDDGTSCWLDTYGRGTGYAWQFGDPAFNYDKARERCERDNPQGCEQYGLIWYPKCAPGFHAVGCCVCEPDGGPGIRKNLFDRQYCNDDEVLEGGLCYKKPRDGFSCTATNCSRNR